MVHARRLVYVAALELGAFLGGWTIGKPSSQFLLACVGGLSMGAGIAWAVGLCDYRPRAGTGSATTRRRT